MPKRICGADLGAKVRWAGIVFRSRNLRAVASNMRCKAPAIKTARGAWRCPLHGGLSTGPRTPEGKAKISAAARARWAAYRAAKPGVPGLA
jgi:hypothetical protein